MAQSYTRQSSFSDGDTITAALFNNEYNQLVNAFAYSSSSASSTGHRHDGTAGHGGNIHTIGDLDFLNKIVADSTNNRWGVFVEVSSAAVEQIRIQDGAIVPVTDNDIDLGTSSLEFKDAYFDGTITTDLLTVSGTTNLDGAIQVDNTITVGVDDTGYDVKFFGDTASAYMLWDTSADDLVLAGAAGIDLAGDIDVDGTANLDNTDIDGTLAVDGTTISLDATTSLNIDNSNTSNGITIGTATSGVPISIGHTTSEVTVNDNLTVTGTLTLGSNAELTEAELEMLDGITAGTVAASKAVVVDSNKDVGTFRNVTIDGTFSDGNYTFDTSGNVSGLGTVGSGAITSSGTIQGTTITATTAFVPDASDGAALGTSSLEFSDLFLADGAVINFGDDQDVSLTHVVDTGLLLSSTDQLQFGDSGTYIYQSADGVLDLVSDTEIELTATTIDINGAADISGNLAVGGNLTVTGTATIAGNLTFGDAASDTVAFSADVASNLLPSADNTYDLGASGSEWKDLYIDGTANIDSLVADTADINGGSIDGATLGTNSAITQAVIDNVNINGATIGHTSDTDLLTLADGALTVAGTVGSGAITSTGTVQGTTITATTAFVPDASDGAALGTSSLEFSDLFLADGAVINFGDDQDVSLTHVVDTGLLLSSTDQLQFGDSGTYIYQSADGVLDLVSDTEIEINATTIDINGAVDISGNLDVGGSLEVATIDYTDGDNAITIADGGGTTFPQTATFTSGIQSNGTVTVGVDDTGYDVKFFGATASAYMLWDESVDDLILAGAARVVVPDGQLVLGSTAVSSTAAELNILDGKAFLDEDNMASDSATGIASQQSIKAYVDAQGGGMSAFIMEDDDGTEVSISNAEEIKFIGSGLTTNWTDTSHGSDGDPFDLTFTVDAAQTGITSLLATDIKIGEDDQTKIDFETADEIHFYAANVEQVYLGDNIFGPQTDSDVDLGATGVRWKDAFVDSITVTGEVDAASLDISGDADIDGTLETDNLTVGGAQGSDGQVLTSTGSGVAWEDAASGVTSLTENNSIWLGNDPSSSTDTASYCVSVGTTSLDAITTGDDNTSMGYDALTALTTGADNCAFGYEAGKALTIGSSNVFIGHGAGKTIDKSSGDQGSMNTFVGQGAGALVTNSQRCTYVGKGAGGQMSEGPTHQTAVGMYASSGHYGTRTTAIGYGCLQTGAGSDMVAVGSTLTSTGSASIMLGYNITDNTSDEVIIGDSASYYTLAYSGSGASWAHSSDERMKKDITTDTLGLSFINDIRPVTFKLKAPSEFPTEWNSYSPPTHTNALGDVVEQRTTPRNTDLQHGLIAQEVKAALDTAGVSTFSGWSEREDGQQRIAKGMFILPLINAVKELTTRLEAAEAKITALEG